MNVDLVTLNLSDGRSLPALGLGTFKIIGREVVTRAVDTALEAGYRLIDTASVYRNEQDIGDVLPHLLDRHKLKRSDIFITSKLGPKDHGANKCREACLRSIKSLGLDYLDLFLVHWPGVQGMKPDDVRQSELRRQSWKDLEQLYNEGLVRAIGVSNYTQRHLQELLQYCRIKPAVLQVEYHPHLVQKQLVEFCVQHGIRVQAYSSLGTSSSENKLLTDPEVTRIALECGRSNAQVLLRWAVRQEIGVLPKSTNAEHIKNNAAVFDFELSEQQMTSLNALDRSFHYCWDPTNIL